LFTSSEVKNEENEKVMIGPLDMKTINSKLLIYIKVEKWVERIHVSKILNPLTRNPIICGYNKDYYLEEIDANGCIYGMAWNIIRGYQMKVTKRIQIQMKQNCPLHRK